MKKKIGFIGCGNMATAMISGILSSHLLDSNDIMASDTSEAMIEQKRSVLPIELSTDNLKIVENCEIVVLAVKPIYYKTVCDQIKNYITNDTLIVSIAAGQTIENIENMIGEDKRLVRCMPNTPAMVNCGVTAICPNKNATQSDTDTILNLFSAFSYVEVVEERLFSAVIAVSGSSPAYVDIFIEAMADAAVMAGMPRAMAYKFASKAVMGSAKMALESGMHPAELKDMVCSPAGTTIEAVRVLEEKGFRSAVIEAMNACVYKADNM